MRREKHQGEEVIRTTTAERLGQWRANARMWHAEIIYTIALAAFIVLAWLAHSYAYFDWDVSIARFVQKLPILGLFGLMRTVSLMGDGWTPYPIVALTVMILLGYHRRCEAAGLLLSAGIGDLLNRLLKLMIVRPRPAAELIAVFRHLPSHSFPSGHVTLYVCYFGFLFFIAYAHLPRRSPVRRLALLSTVIPVVLVGMSRVYLGEHWPSDALGAYLLGGIWLAFSLDVYRRCRQRADSDQKPDC